MSDLRMYLLTGLFLLSLDLSYGREWTNNKNEVIEAELVAKDGDRVILAMRGKEYRVPVNSLSDADQKYLKSELTRRAKVAAEEAKKFMGHELVRGKKNTFTFPLSEENQNIALKGGKGWGSDFTNRYSGSWVKSLREGHAIEKCKIEIGLPKDFDPSKGCPIFIQWNTSDHKSHLRGTRRFWPTCNSEGWMLVSIEGAPDSKTTWSNSVFYAGVKEFFEQLHQKYPGSKEWPVATGGFSGGSKICQWMGGLMDELEGVNLRGYWIGGCNESFFEYAVQDLSVSKKTLRGVKAYISCGNQDKYLSARSNERVLNGIKEFGLQVRQETYGGAHKVSKKQLAEAFAWFLKE